MIDHRKAYGRAGVARVAMLGAAMIGTLTVPEAAHAQATAQAEARNSGPAVGEGRLQPDRGSSTTMLRFSGSNRTGVAYCASRHVVFSGNNGNVTLRGGCRSLTIQGSNNRVTVEVEAGALIQVRGQSNAVHWHLVSGMQQPKVRDLGRGNSFKTQT